MASFCALLGGVVVEIPLDVDNGGALVAGIYLEILAAQFLMTSSIHNFFLKIQLLLKSHPSKK